MEKTNYLKLTKQLNSLDAGAFVDNELLIKEEKDSRIRSESLSELYGVSIMIM